MKLSELFRTSEDNLSEARMETKGNWRIGNLNGVIKTFKRNDSPEALAWMKNRDTAASLSPRKSKEERDSEKFWKEREREEKRAERERNRKPTNDELRDLYDEVVQAAGSSFPDGDPIDHFGDTLRRRNWTMDTVDLAFKKFGSGREKKGYDQFMIDMWDDFAGDQTADANMDIKAGRTPERSQFYDIVDGKAVKAKNPWKPH